MATRARAHHRIVHDLIREGLGPREITRKLTWSRDTVHRYENAQRWQDMVTPPPWPPDSTENSVGTEVLAPA